MSMQPHIPAMTATVHHRFIEPLDVLVLRGNKLFGDPGSHGESLVPPWPWGAAGALRSAMLAREGVDLAAFARGEVAHAALGTPLVPGSFAVVAFTLARRLGGGRIESLHALPADLVAAADAEAAGTKLKRLAPTAPTAGLSSSVPLPLWPVLAEAARSKPASGFWLTQAGWADYLAGRAPDAAAVLRSTDLWGEDLRTGVGLDPARRRAADGQLFTVQAVAFRPGIGFLASVEGAEPPADGTLRFGGDGRGAALHAAAYRPPAADFAAIARSARARVVLTTPGLFPEGWCLPGVDEQQRIRWPGLNARLVCAAVARAEIVSGWDLALRQPKAAERVAPAGSVYWLDEIESTPEALGKLAAQGLWFGDHQNAPRRAEGFNRFTFAAW
jgi:CRISPR-associated protein Cmr3